MSLQPGQADLIHKMMRVQRGNQPLKNHGRKHTQAKGLALVIVNILMLGSAILPLTTSMTPAREAGRGDDGGTPRDMGDDFFPSKFARGGVDAWRKVVDHVDGNRNGIHDDLDEMLQALLRETTIAAESNHDNEVIHPSKEFTSFVDTRPRSIHETWNLTAIPVIAHFPPGNIDPIIDLFIKKGGIIRSTFDTAINGFSGHISYRGLEQVASVLRSNDVPFIIEEDSPVEAKLYWSSKTMNLRPYTWNTLGFEGDPGSSIAIIDTGIDDSHAFFSPGYADQDSSHKIVGWWDKVNGNSQPYDDNGHGSRCAGIAAGTGGPTIDSQGRIVATWGYALSDRKNEMPQTLNRTAASFNVTRPGILEVEGEFEDLTSATGEGVYMHAFLHRGETVVDSHVQYFQSWNHNLSYTVTGDQLGEYSLRISITSHAEDGQVDDPVMKSRFVMRVPFNASDTGGGDPWKGVAPNARLVGIKVLDAAGRGSDSDVIDGINWAITNRFTYNITVISISLGGAKGKTSLITAVNNAVEHGIVTVVAAGNGGAGSNRINSPADADNVITVVATSSIDRITDYSSSCGPSFSGATTKPDIAAPGGSYYNFTMFSADSNDNDVKGAYPDDAIHDDLTPGVGTSMATAAVAGAANLVIQAMGGGENWNFTGTEAKRVKAILLMTATETYPNTREVATIHSPTLERGGKDIHEGYGRMNIDAAIEALTVRLLPATTVSQYISSSAADPLSKHAFARHVDLHAGIDYNFWLDVPSDADFDLHVYSNDPTPIGEPVLVVSSINASLGGSELVSFTPTSTGRYFIVVKAISGSGVANLSIQGNDHAPVLSGQGVDPGTGTQMTSFNFTVVYSDADGNPPAHVHVVINGTVHAMEKVEQLGINYTAGCLYYTLVYLQPGTYEFHFETSDGLFTNVTQADTNLNVTGTNDHAPVLSNGGVSPGSGYTGVTTFTFSVTYTDADNNAPAWVNVSINGTTHTMNKLDPLDTNYMDGCQYSTSMQLQPGTYEFHFETNDGLFTNSTGAFTGPVVQEIATPSQISHLVATSHVAQVNLGWNAPYDGGSVIIAYHVHRNGTLVHSTNGTTTSWSDGTVLAGNIYTYTITAENDVGNGTVSQPATGNTVPAQVPGLVTTGGNQQVTLTWSAPADGGSPVILYNIYRSESDPGTYSLIGTNSSATGFVDTGLLNDTTYFYNIAAVNDVGEGMNSLNATATTSTVPGQVGLVVSSHAGQVNLTWGSPASGGSPVIAYHIHRNGTLVHSTSGMTTSWSDGTVLAGNIYTYTITAENDVGNGTVSQPATGNTVPGQVGLVVSSHAGQVNLTWGSPASGGSPVIAYHVHRNGTLVHSTSGTTTSWSDGTVLAGNIYTYTITAENNVGNGTASAPVIASVNGDTNLADTYLIITGVGGGAAVVVIAFLYTSRRKKVRRYLGRRAGRLGASRRDERRI